jgi:hypothetical protein
MNPYGTSVEPTGQAITAQMTEALRKTKPWVRMLSILGFIGSGLMIIIALFVMASGAIGGAMGRSFGLGAAGGIALGLVYGLMALLYIFPSLFLFRYASAIASMLSEDTVRGMENALEAQKSFWRFIGILTVVMLSLYAVVLVVVVIGAIIAAASR